MVFCVDCRVIFFFNFFFFLLLRRPPRSTLSSSSAASDVYKRQLLEYKQIGPQFYTFGNPYMTNNIREFTIKDRLSLLGRRLMFVIGYSSKDNNLSEVVLNLSLIHISEPTRQAEISYAVFCLKKKKKKTKK